MTCKDAVIQLSSVACKSFEWLEEAMRSAPVLAMTRAEGDCFLETDASLFALGAALHQYQDGQLRCIEFASRALSKHERNYCTTRREV